MKQYFDHFADRLFAGLHAGEVLLLNLAAERSDFVRFNRSRVRQAGSVVQRFLALRLVHGRRHASADLTLTGTDEDVQAARATLARLRDAIAGLPEDPWLHFNEQPQSSTSERRGVLAPAESVVEQVTGAAHGLDLVGLYAAGTQFRGFANSLGQRNWHEVDSFNFDWSLHGEADRAVKSGYAGFDWDAGALAARVTDAARTLAQLAGPVRVIEPGEYRAYLAPRALEELTGLLGWGGFSARARATRRSPLLRLELGDSLSSLLTVSESTAAGIAPGFQAEGFVKPAAVPLLREGRLAEVLVSPRSAKEYGLACNAANGAEAPESLDVAPGALAPPDVLAALDTGLYIANLWYLNYSDRAAGRITGMTRFATSWVEGGRVVAPARPMRFDDSLFRMLGENLVALTREREFLPDASTYGERSSASARLPGALLRSLRLTL